MKHLKRGKHFNRDTKGRKALFRSLLNSLVLYEEIKTTKTKAKAIKRLIDRLIVKAKVGSLTNRRQLLAFLPNKKVVDKLIKDIAPRFQKTTSGFSRIIFLGRRKGDDALMAKVELTNKKVKKNKKKKDSKKSKKDQGKKEAEKK